MIADRKGEPESVITGLKTGGEAKGEGGKPNNSTKKTKKLTFGGKEGFAGNPLQAKQVMSYYKLIQSAHFPGGNKLLERKPK